MPNTSPAEFYFIAAMMILILIFCAVAVFFFFRTFKKKKPRRKNAGKKKPIMPKKNDLHGNAPDKSKIALLILDMISDFEFEDGEKLFKYAKPAARNIAKLKEKAEKARVPVIYVNDNFGRWQSDFKKLFEHSSDKKYRGHEIAELLKPSDEDYFVLKPKHSGFFSTTLEVLLEYLGAETLIITGVATDICVLFTANDAYMRDFNLVIPRDCVAANTAKANRDTLNYLKNLMQADTRESSKIDFKKLKVKK